MSTADTAEESPLIAALGGQPPALSASAIDDCQDGVLLSFWQLIGFEDALDRWTTIETPTLDLRFVVIEWVVGRSDDPYTGVRRRPEVVASNFWFGAVPGTREGDQVVVCSYWIDESSRSVRCDAIATLGLGDHLICERTIWKRSHELGIRPGIGARDHRHASTVGRPNAA